MRRAERAGVWPGGSPTLGAAGGDPPPRDPELRRPTHASPPGAGGRRADFFSGIRDLLRSCLGLLAFSNIRKFHVSHAFSNIRELRL